MSIKPVHNHPFAIAVTYGLIGLLSYKLFKLQAPNYRLTYCLADVKHI